MYYYQDLNTVLKKYHSYFKENISPQSLAVFVNEPISGSLKLHTPDGLGSLNLTCDDEMVFWSFFAHDFCSIFLARTYGNKFKQFQPLGYINSTTTESIFRLPEHEQGLAWNKYFVSQLFENQAGLLGKGEWHFEFCPSKPLPRKEKRYCGCSHLQIDENKIIFQIICFQAAILMN